MAERHARVERISSLHPDVLVVDARLSDPAELSWRAGQFVSLRCVGAADPNVRRSYSIASSPLRNTGFELLVKLIPDGVGSDLFRNLNAGDELHFTGPMGFFTCDLSHVGDVVFAATGTGVAAALPMMEELARRGETGKILLYWGMRTESELYWLDRLDELARSSPRIEVKICLSRSDQPLGDGRLAGHINEHILAGGPALDRPVYYLVGNGAMVRDLKKALIESGVDRKKQLRTEIFYPVAT
jgi:ferredoxin-NADP reductase